MLDLKKKTLGHNEEEQIINLSPDPENSNSFSIDGISNDEQIFDSPQNTNEKMESLKKKIDELGEISQPDASSDDLIAAFQKAEENKQNSEHLKDDIKINSNEDNKETIDPNALKNGEINPEEDNINQLISHPIGKEYESIIRQLSPEQQSLLARAFKDNLLQRASYDERNPQHMGGGSGNIIESIRKLNKKMKEGERPLNDIEFLKEKLFNIKNNEINSGLTNRKDLLDSLSDNIDLYNSHFRNSKNFTKLELLARSNGISVEELLNEISGKPTGKINDSLYNEATKLAKEIEEEADCKKAKEAVELNLEELDKTNKKLFEDVKNTSSNFQDKFDQTTFEKSNDEFLHKLDKTNKLDFSDPETTEKMKETLEKIKETIQNIAKMIASLFSK